MTYKLRKTKLNKGLTSLGLGVAFLAAASMGDETTASANYSQTAATLNLGQSFEITQSVKGFSTAFDAMNGTNVRTHYPAGKYFIYKHHGGATNITTKPGKPGVWVKTSDLRLKQTQNNWGQTSNNNQNSQQAGKYVVHTNINGFRTASDALYGRNVSTQYRPGTYYIFREYNGMINISTQPGKPGVWINPKTNSKPWSGNSGGNHNPAGGTKKTPQNVSSPTYINGILLVNKKHPLPQNYNPGENKEAKAKFDSLRQGLRWAGHNISNHYSGFRSYNHQASLYRNYVAQHGQRAADTFSARPGYSEHQTGLAFDLIDLNGRALGEEGSSRASKNAAAWVAKNAHKYGFIVRYQPNNSSVTGYMSEPWHLRYVGEKVATEIYNRNITLEAYLNAPGGDY